LLIDGVVLGAPIKKLGRAAGVLKLMDEEICLSVFWGLFRTFGGRVQILAPKLFFQTTSFLSFYRLGIYKSASIRVFFQLLMKLFLNQP